MIPFTQIDERLEKLGKNRAWLVEATGRSEGAIRSALAPKASDKHRSELLQRVLSEAIQKEEDAQRSCVRLPDQLALAPTPEEFDAWDRASRAARAPTLRDWAIDELNKAAAAWHASKVIPISAVADDTAIYQVTPKIDLPYFGTVAAGLPGGPVDVADGTHPVSGNFDPATHYVLRVHGESMQPDYANGSFIVCRKLKTGEFATKGQDVIACDGSGAYFKRLLYTKDGKKSDNPRKAKPHLTSINPDYPEVTPLTECPIVGVVVAKA